MSVPSDMPCCRGSGSHHAHPQPETGIARNRSTPTVVDSPQRNSTSRDTRFEEGTAQATASMTGGKPCTDSLPTDSPVQQSASGCRGLRNGCAILSSAIRLHFGTCLPSWDFPDAAPRRKDPNWQECPQPAGKHTQKVSQSAGMSPTAGKRPRGLAEDGGKSQNGGQRPRGLAQDGGKRPKRRTGHVWAPGTSDCTRDARTA